MDSQVIKLVPRAKKVASARASHPPGAASARSAGLLYADVDAPGISRVKRGGGFSYRTASGRVLRDPRTLVRIHALVIPPAWTDVWIAPNPHAHIQATGRDAAGRKQYRYHALWIAERDSTKYTRMLAFAAALPAIRKRVARDLREPSASRARVLATVVTLLERTHLRVGNEEYVRSNRSHGLTTLRNRHVTIRGRKLRFDFRAKGGIQQTVDVDDARLARAVRECQDLPGQTLFQYVDDDGKVRGLSSSDVNTYLQETSGGTFTAKDYRTWAGTLAAAQALDGSDRPSSRTDQKTIVAAIDQVAGALGNTRAVCRKCYIHPAVLDAFVAGVTLGQLSVRSPRGLYAAEARLVALLRRMDRKQAA